MMLTFALLLGVFAISLVGTGWLSVFLRRRRVMDIPGERSSHAVATPRGGGLAIVASILVGMAICLTASPDTDNNLLVLLAGGVVLAALSWADDLKSLPPAVRFTAHAVVVGLSLPALGLDGAVLPFDPPIWLDRLLLGIAWLGFLNFFNFMDGIDGISVVETAIIGIGIILLKVVHDSVGSDILMITILVSATIGFGWWNWSPAKLFMGDVGSVFLGYLLGGFLVLLASDGYLAAAIILPVYYLFDATTTLIRRALRGERIWQAHKQHFYQRAVQVGRSHAMVSTAILLTGLGLIILALLSVPYPVPALVASVLLVAGLCIWMPRMGQK